jgi:hypothetical protein
VYIFANGQRWEGEQHNDRVDGYGMYVWPSDDSYEGGFHQGKDGYGIFTWPDGEHYEGEFRDDKRNGWGYMAKGAATTRTGYWENDQLVQSGEVVTAGTGTQEPGALPPPAAVAQPALAG